MGNNSSATAPGTAAPLTTDPSNATGSTTTPTTTSMAPNTNTTPAAVTTTTTTATTSTPTTSWKNLMTKAKDTSTTPASTTVTTTTPTPSMNWTTLTTKAKDASTTPASATVTTTTPTPSMNWTTLTAKAKDASIVPESTTSTPKPTFYTLVKSVTAETDQAKSTSSAYAHWYKYSKFEQEKRAKGKRLWYMTPPVTTAATSSPTTPTPTMTSAIIRSDTKEVSDLVGITAVPSFQLRSTAVYSPPHGDRIPPGRDELINTNTSVFKYYVPKNQLEQTTGIHSKATMYVMDTRSRSRRTPLSYQSSSLTAVNTNSNTNATESNAPLPTFASRGLQTDLQLPPPSMRHYEQQTTKIVPATAFAGNTSSSNGFYHIPPQNTTSQPRSSATSSHRPPPPPSALPPSILKNSSTVLSQDMSNPLSERTHDQVLEELRQRNKNTKDGAYPIKKVHLLERNDPAYPPATVLFDLPQPPRTKAKQSITRSETLFFSQSFNRKK